MLTRKFQELLDEMSAARRKRVAKRVEHALSAMSLEKLRRAMPRQSRRKPYERIKESKIEHRTDVYLSTLASYMETLGGRLEIRAVFQDREMRISQFEGLAKERST